MYVDVTGDCVRSEGHWGVNYVCSRWYRRTEPLKLEFSRRGVTGGVTVTQFTEYRYVVRKISTSSNTYILGYWWIVRGQGVTGG